MKITFLNTWNGRRRDEIIQFIKEESHDTNIFCFQEVYKEMESICDKFIQNYQNVTLQKINDNDHVFSQAIYFNDTVKLISFEEILGNQNKAGLGIYAHFKFLNRDVHVCNMHGTALPIAKLDTPERVDQSQGLIDFFSHKDGLKIIGGDFNLLPETESIKIFEKNNYLDLIKNFRIDTTRNELAWKKYPNNKQEYADYVFISPDIKVENFSVPQIEISDHLPLILSFT